MPAPSTYRTDEHFSIVPHSLAEHPDCTPYHIATYFALRGFADHGKETGARVGDRRAAARACMSVRKFIDCRQNLREWGWLTWTRLPDGGINEYVIHATRARAAHGASPAAPGADPPSAQGAHPSAQGADNREPVTESHLSTESSEVSSDESSETPAPSFTANDLVDLVTQLGLRGHRPPDWGKQNRAAQRLLKVGLRSEPLVREACRGMRLKFPWALPPLGKADTFDVMRLEKNLAEALSLAATQDKPPSESVSATRAPPRPYPTGPTPLAALVEGVLEKVRARVAATADP